MPGNPSPEASDHSRALPAGERPLQPVGADQVSRFTARSLAILFGSLAVLVVAGLWYADYWVWVHVSYAATFEAVVAESNVALAVGALFAVWTSTGDAQNTREMLRQMHEQHLEMHKPRSSPPPEEPPDD
jgi:hypothetical protein